MVEPLEGLERRVFHALLRESDRNTIREIWSELTWTEMPPDRDPPASTESIEETLEALALRGYIEECRGGHWWVTGQARMSEESLLGLRT